jgi:tetratricopeptide (TPR) repeat protein
MASIVLDESMLKGALYKRKDFVGKEEDAKSHPNRTYYYRKNVDVGALIESCTRKLQADPENAKALYIRASSFMKQKSFPEAVRDYTRALEINPVDVGSLYNRGIANEKLGRTKESIQDYTDTGTVKSLIVPSMNYFSTRNV